MRTWSQQNLPKGQQNRSEESAFGSSGFTALIRENVRDKRTFSWYDEPELFVRYGSKYDEL